MADLAMMAIVAALVAVCMVAVYALGAKTDR